MAWGASDAESAAHTLAVGLSFVLFVEQVVCSFLPLALRRLQHHRWYLSLLNCFSGGIFMGLALLHSLPELIELHEELVTSGELQLGPYARFPLAAFIGLIGYYLSLSMDHVIYNPDVQEEEQPQHENIALGWTKSCQLDSARSTDLGQPCSSACGTAGPGAAECPDKLPIAASDCDIERMESPHDETSRKDCSNVFRPSHAMAPALLVMCALVFHQAIESIRLGTASSTDEVLELFVGIVVHRPASAIALGTQFIKAGGTWRDLLLYLVPFSALTPIAVALGTLISGESLATYVLNCFSMGVFLYIGATDINGEELGTLNHGPQSLPYWARRWIKLALMLMGMMAMAALSLYE